jgi:protein TonB
MTRDGILSLIVAAGCHGAVLFGITIPPREVLPVPPEPEQTYVEVVLAEAPPSLLAAPAVVAPPPPPEVKPPPVPEPPPPPPKEPVPPPPPPKVEVMKLPEPPPPPPAPAPVPTKPVAAPVQVAAAAAPVTTNEGPAVAGPPAAKGPSETGDKYQRVSAASYKKKSKLEYPDRAKKENQEGNVLLTLYINEFGGLDKVEVKESSGYPLLDQAAVANEKKSKFNPTYIGNRPVASKAEVPYSFKLK